MIRRTLIHLQIYQPLLLSKLWGFQRVNWEGEMEGCGDTEVVKTRAATYLVEGGGSR